MRSSADEVEVDGEVRSSGLSERSETSDAPIKPELIISPKTGTFFKIPCSLLAMGKESSSGGDRLSEMASGLELSLLPSLS